VLLAFGAAQDGLDKPEHFAIADVAAVVRHGVSDADAGEGVPHIIDRQHPAVLLNGGLFDRQQHVPIAAPGTEAVHARHQDGVQQGRDGLLERLGDHAIHDDRQPQLPEPAVALGDQHGADRVGAVAVLRDRPGDHPPSGAASRRVPQEQKPDRTDVVIVGWWTLLLLGLISVALLSGPSGRPSDGLPKIPPGPGGQSSLLPAPAFGVTNRDGLRRALEEGDRLWDAGQKAEAARCYSAAMASPCLAEFKEAAQRVLPRLLKHYADENNAAAADDVLRLLIEKGINLQYPDPLVQQHIDELKAEVMGDRLQRQFQELGITPPEGPVTQEFTDGVNAGLEQGRAMAKILKRVENDLLARQSQLETCLKMLRDQERETAEFVESAKVAQAAEGNRGPATAAVHRYLGLAAGLRAAFRKAGIVP
jgi:hypothetical protein